MTGARFLAYLRGIETCPSRRGWRGWCKVFSLPTRDWNQDIKVHVDVGLRVFSLPTRDWNDRRCRRSASAAEFLAYLRGIETVLAAVARVNYYLFLAYLRGIETDKHTNYIFFREGF